MRISEIANADEQLALWKLINTNVWAAIEAQSKQQAQQRASSVQSRKSKRPRKLRTASVPNVPMPKPLPTQPKTNQLKTGPLKHSPNSGFAQNKSQPTQKSVGPTSSQVTKSVASAEPTATNTVTPNALANPTSQPTSPLAPQTLHRLSPRSTQKRDLTQKTRF